MIRHDGVMCSYTEVADVGPCSLGHYTVIDDTAHGPHSVGVLALGISIGAAIEVGEVAVTAEL